MKTLIITIQLVLVQFLYDNNGYNNVQTNVIGEEQNMKKLKIDPDDDNKIHRSSSLFSPVF